MLCQLVVHTRVIAAELAGADDSCWNQACGGQSGLLGIFKGRNLAYPIKLTGPKRRLAPRDRFLQKRDLPAVIGSMLRRAVQHETEIVVPAGDNVVEPRFGEL